MPSENLPTPHDALLLPRTPTEQHYRRNHYSYPEVDAASWRLEVTGAVRSPASLTLTALRSLPSQCLPVLLECAGHRRTEFQPPISGVQWKTGALGEAEWRGVPLAAVLEEAGVQADAVEVVLYGADRGAFSGLEGEFAFARSLPLEKALHPDTVLAYEMNGEPLPEIHGAPVRAIVPGWYAMDSVKWLNRIEVVSEPFRGPYQELDYRFQSAEETGIGWRLAEVPINSLILKPEEGEALASGRALLQGIAWGGADGVARVEVRVDGGAWEDVPLHPASGPYGKHPWSAERLLPPGEHRLAVRATDGTGRPQPEQAEWNRRGYMNNGVHEVRVRVS